MIAFHTWLAAPELFVIGLGFVVLCCAMSFRHSEHVGRTLSIVAMGGLGSTLLYLLFGGLHGYAFYETFRVDGLSLFFKALFVLTGILVLLLSYNYMRRFVYKGEYVALVLFAIGAMMFLASANEFMTVFLALETVTLSFYFLSAYNKKNPKSSEAGLKMYVQGVLSTAILLYGISLFYGMTGTTYLAGMSQLLLPYKWSPLLVLASVFVIAGLGFKIAIAPFHMWVPDVYEGAPLPVTAFLSVASKAAGLVVLIRFLYHVLGDVIPWTIILAVLAVLTMCLGNLIAMQQRNVKRMMAYSSIAHVGYIMIGLVAFNHRGLSALMVYLLVYALGNILVFACIIAASMKLKSHNMENYAGLGRNSPFIGIAMLVGFLSLIGLPPLGGFVGKLFLFAAGIETGHYLLVIAAVLNSVISVYYYLNVARFLFLEKGKARVSFTKSQYAVVLFCLIALLVLGLWPGLAFGYIDYLTKVYILL